MCSSPDGPATRRFFLPCRSCLAFRSACRFTWPKSSNARHFAARRAVATRSWPSCMPTISSWKAWRRSARPCQFPSPPIVCTNKTTRTRLLSPKAVSSCMMPSTNRWENAPRRSAERNGWPRPGTPLRWRAQGRWGNAQSCCAVPLIRVSSRNTSRSSRTSRKSSANWCAKTVRRTTVFTGMSTVSMASPTAPPAHRFLRKSAC